MAGVHDKHRERLLKELGLEDDPYWQNATLKELLNYRQIVSFYHFWIWEYERRNQRYQIKYMVNFQPTSDKGHIPCDPEIGLTSAEILQRLCEGTFERKEPKSFFWYNPGVGLDYFSYLDHLSSNGYQIKYHFEQEYGAVNKINLDISFNLQSNPKAMSDKLYEVLRWAKKNLEDKPIEEMPETFEQTQKIRDINLQQPAPTGKRKPHDSDEKRAVGIWLWDYLQQNNSSKAEAIRELRERFNLQQLGLDDTPERKFYYYLANAKSCIQKCEVISL